MYKVYIGDKYGYGSIKVNAKNENEARKMGKNYIEIWKLKEAYIDYITKI